MSVCMRTSYLKYTLLQIFEPKRLHVSHESKVLLNMESWCQSTPRSTPQTMQEKLRCRRTDTTHRPTYSMARAI